MIAEGHGKKSGGLSQTEGQGRLKAEGGNDRRERKEMVSS